MNEADLRDFFAIVADMRVAQKTYFSTREHVDLARSKELERMVDQFIDNMNQPSLFGDQS